MRILMMLHMPWRRELGGSRVQFELAEELRAMGHEVDKYDIRDACPEVSGFRPEDLLVFADRARGFVREQGAKYDVIDAHQGNLPWTKSELGFTGLLVTRSVGLFALYEEFNQYESRQWPPRRLRTRVGNVVRRLKSLRTRKPDYRRSIEVADLFLGMNEDECRYAEEQFGLAGRCAVAPYGLPVARAEMLRSANASPEDRLAGRQVAVVGAWTPRKGSHDWGAIVRAVRERVGNARFLFLGTGANAATVHEELGLAPCDWITVVPYFKSEELPGLLRDATVGALPTYIEGFGIGILECLAAGIPTVSYDVPGPRDMLRKFARPMMSPRGDAAAYATMISEILQLPLPDYTALSRDSLAVAGNFSAPLVARETLAQYEAHRARLQHAAEGVAR